jgi:hypothetical protein
MGASAKIQASQSYNHREANVQKRILLALSLTLIAGSQALATDINFGSAIISQGNFRDLSKEAGAAISFKNTASAEPLGITGFDAGVEVSATDIKSNSPYWSAAFGGDAPSYLYLPKLRVRKGLPFDIDLGAMYSYVPNSNIKLYGIELSKALLDGTMATPAIGIRGTYTRLAGVNDFELQTAGIDATISKGLLFLTPYAGAGGLWVSGRATGNLSADAAKNNTPLTAENIFQPRVFAGLKVTPIPLLAITAEAEYEVRPTYSLKVAATF